MRISEAGATAAVTKAVLVLILLFVIVTVILRRQIAFCILSNTPNIMHPVFHLSVQAPCGVGYVLNDWLNPVQHHEI